MSAETAPTGTEATTARIAQELARHGLIGKSVPAGEHECHLITKPHNGCGCTRIIVGCEGCPDWTAEADGTQGEAFNLHVAAVLSAGVIRDREAAALREAADVCSPGWMWGAEIRRWLRDRAAHIEET